MIIEPWVIHMLDHLMSQTAERVSSAWELLTSLRTVMVCNDVIRLYPVRVQQQGVDIEHHYHNDRARTIVRAYAVRLIG